MKTSWFSSAVTSNARRQGSILEDSLACLLGKGASARQRTLALMSLFSTCNLATALTRRAEIICQFRTSDCCMLHGKAFSYKPTRVFQTSMYRMAGWELSIGAAPAS
jgi:hypothetical protein